VDIRLCGYQDIGGWPWNGRMQLDHGRLLAASINNNLMAGMLRHSDVQRAEVYFLYVLEVAVPDSSSDLKALTDYHMASLNRW